jgi:signal transduction histidine kinase/CheY-like chemotaxis protein
MPPQNSAYSLSERALPGRAATARPPVSRDDAERAAHLKRQQLELLALQATRSPFAIFIAVGFVTYIVWGQAPLPLVALWAAALAAVLFTRMAYALRLLSTEPADAQPALSRMTGFAFANGAVTGASMPLFFHALSFEGQALLTMVLVCWSAGGVSTAAAYARAFYAFVGPTLLPAAAVWAMTASLQNVILGVLILMFGLIQIFFVRDNERVVRESFSIRYDNERLLKALEAERQEAALARDRAEDANRAKSRFLAAASHDLRQPLHALSLYSAVLKLRATDPSTGEIAEQISKASSALTALVDSLLDISKLDAGAIHPELRAFDLRKFVERIGADFRPVAEQKGLAFSVESSDAEVLSDPVLLERVLRNLLDNAVKYTRDGSVRLVAAAQGDQVRLAVRDSGIGIAPQERERVFEEFYQIGNPERDRTRGLGLGLAIVRRLAQLLKLDVEVESAPGRGTSFSLTLPRARASQPVASVPLQPAADTPTGLEGNRVLVIDDEPAVRSGMQTLLETWGCQVTACASLAEAERALAADAGADLILADLRLRNEENGIETVRRLRARIGEVPALLISGDTAPERLREAEASGLPLLHKPVPVDTLRAQLLALLAR